jgi:integrase
VPRVRVVNTNLKKRGNVWWLRKRVPLDVCEAFGCKVVAETLRTRDVKEARRRRDARLKQLEAEWEALRRGVDKSLIDMAYDEYQASARKPITPDDYSFRDNLIDRLHSKAAEWGHREGLLDPFSDTEVYDAVRDRFIAETLEGQRLDAAIRATKGELPLVEAGERLFENTPLSEGTKREYRRAYKRCAEHFPFVTAVDRREVALYLQSLARGDDGKPLGKKSIENIQIAMAKLWRFFHLDGSVWQRHELAVATPEVIREVWSLEEVKVLLEASIGTPLHSAILIALHTGARVGEIAGLQYDADKDWLVIPREATKTDAGARAIPCPDAIRGAVVFWCADPMAANSITNRFGELKRALGHGPEKVFHSFRHTLASRLNEMDVPEAKVAAIIGHKHKSMTFGRYGNKIDPETLRSIMNRIDWLGPLERLNPRTPSDTPM